MSIPALSPADLQSILQFTIGIARNAGKLILEGSEAIQSASSKVSDVGEKKNSVDLVTEFDVRVEELVKKEIGIKYPKFKLYDIVSLVSTYITDGGSSIGEESYSAGSRPPLTDEPTFCVDPIDGTTNFVHGFPFVCISLGLIYKRRPVLGVIYNPFLDHLGSYLTRGINSKPSRLPLSSPPKPLPSISQALLAVEWGSDRTQNTMSTKAGSFHRLAGDPAQGVLGGKMAHSLRSMGSAALNFAMVAQGGLTYTGAIGPAVYVAKLTLVCREIGCWPWDVCAGIVIAQEAGGVTVGSHGHFTSTVSSKAFGDVTEDVLTGRKYVVIRAIGDTPTERGSDAQKRIIEEFYATVEEAEPN
ncbi:myo inositol monophosphatase [Infundibulicybe gibba]|nr:myo inositol monophosphatase [Infundibulicybe gibba]